MEVLRRRYLLIIVAVAVLLLIPLTYWAIIPLASAYRQNVEEEIVLKVPRNTTKERLAEMLEPQLKSAFTFRQALRIKALADTVAPGYYRIAPGTENLTIIRRLLYNHQTPYKLVISGNLRGVERLAALLGQRLMADSAAFAECFNSEETLQRCGLTREELPALFLPNSYEVWWTITPKGFVERMIKEWKTFWNAERMAKAEELGLTPVEVSTLASIVCEESNKTAELPIIAGVYINRLKRGIKLDADPTVKFAVGDFALRRVLNKHLAVDSPYNTYKNKGLPPGPITIPSIAGIDAVLNYARHNYLFFCASPAFDGSHRFAATIGEHNRNAEAYRAALNKRGIK